MERLTATTLSAGRVGRRPLEGGGGDVDGRHPPALPGEPDRITSFTAAEVQRRAGRQRPGDVDQDRVSLPAPHPFVFTVVPSQNRSASLPPPS